VASRVRSGTLNVNQEFKLTRNCGSGLSRVSTRSFDPIDEEPHRPERSGIRSVTSFRSAASSAAHSPTREHPPAELGARPGIQRSTTHNTATSDPGSLVAQRMVRTTSDNLSIRTQKANLRATARAPGADIFDDPSDQSGNFSHGTSSPDRSFGERAASPATSVTSSTGSGRRKPPPPPPPSRSTKPPPPPPPMKRSGLGSSNVTA
jgi:hypothetical protein